MAVPKRAPIRYHKAIRLLIRNTNGRRCRIRDAGLRRAREHRCQHRQNGKSLYHLFQSFCFQAMNALCATLLKPT